VQITEKVINNAPDLSSDIILIDGFSGRLRSFLLSQCLAAS